MTLIDTEKYRSTAGTIAIFRWLIASPTGRFSTSSDLPRPAQPAKPIDSGADAATRLYNLANGAGLRR